MDSTWQPCQPYLGFMPYEPITWCHVASADEVMTLCWLERFPKLPETRGKSRRPIRTVGYDDLHDSRCDLSFYFAEFCWILIVLNAFPGPQQSWGIWASILLIVFVCLPRTPARAEEYKNASCIHYPLHVDAWIYVSSWCRNINSPYRKPHNVVNDATTGHGNELTT